MENIKQLLTNALDPQARLMAETRGLVSKWEKTGLLEGLGSDFDKGNMSVLLESQAKQLVVEASQTGNSQNAEQWAGVALPLVRRVFAEIAAKEFVSVQPMNLPSGLVFYLDFKYGTNSGVFKQDGSTNGYQSLFGGTGAKSGSTDSPTGGLYGAGRYAYTVNDQTLDTITVTCASASLADVWFDTGNAADPVGQAISQSLAAGELHTITTTDLYTKTVAAHGGNAFDANAVRSFVWSGSNGASGSLATLNGETMIPQYTRLSGNEVVFVITGSRGLIPTTSNTRVIYSVQPVDYNRGDFEDRLGASTDAADTGLNKDIGIPEVNLELRSEPIVAKTRKLKAVWTPELAQDLNAYHSIDAEAELTALLSEYVSMEIDLEILDMLINAAPDINKERWSAKINREIVKVNGSYVVQDTTATTQGGYYTKATWYQTIGNKIQKVSNRIHQLTLRGGANFMVCGPDVATILESIPGFVVNTDGDQAKFAMGVSRVGSFASRFQVYKNPYMQENIILLGFRGNNFLETGAVYAPYIPLIQTPLVYDPVNFTPRRGVMTRYAKKMVRPEFYGLLYVSDLNQV